VAAAMTSQRNGLEVRIETMGNGKKWFFVSTPPEGSPVSFEDWWQMVRAFCVCEIDKYTNRYGGDPTDPEEWDRWTLMARDFITACFDQNRSYDELRRPVQIATMRAD